MSFSFNRAIVGGNLTRDPELRFTNSGIPVCNFGIAVNRVRSKNDEVDFFEVTAWRELGETIANYKKKGEPILVEGRLQFSPYEDRNGNKRSKVEIIADNVQFIGRANGDGDSNGGGSQPRQQQQQQRPQRQQRQPANNVPDFDDDDDFSDIPF